MSRLLRSLRPLALAVVLLVTILTVQPGVALAAASTDAPLTWSFVYGCDYDGPAASTTLSANSRIDAQVAGASARTASRSSTPPIARNRAAKEGAEGTTRVGRWMDEAELEKMRKTGRVQEGGGGRTYVTRPANPDSYPAGRGVFAEFDVLSKFLHPASKPEWAVIPGPNAGTRRYGPLPTEMPRATCIKVTCRR